MAKIVIATIGTSGDLNPYLAIGIELKKRGHHITIASSPQYAQKVISSSLNFSSLRPDIDYNDPALALLTMNRFNGTEYVLKEMLMKPISETYEDLLKAVDGANLLVSHSLCFAGSMVAEITRIPWISSVLSPNNFWSCYDPIVLPNAPFFRHLHRLGISINERIISLAKFATRDWADSVYQLRNKIGLPKGENPLFEGMHSPHAVIALFSDVFAKNKPDWPQQVVSTGFPIFYETFNKHDSDILGNFLNKGEPPIVFTLGTAAVLDANNFYEDGLKACKELGQRAILLTGTQKRNIPESLGSTDDVLQIDYAPYSDVFKHAKVVVHHGGIGTTAQVLHAGCPSLVVPYSHDQPDNADRLLRLGCARVEYRHRITHSVLKKNLQKLINNPSYGQAAKLLQQQINHENGAIAAADFIEIKLEESN